jgi:hypothetical protein
MSETKPSPTPEVETTSGPAEKQCFLCGREESGAWHYAASLGTFVCEECYRRAMSSPATEPGKT